MRVFVAGARAFVGSGRGCLSPGVRLIWLKETNAGRLLCGHLCLWDSALSRCILALAPITGNLQRLFDGVVPSCDLDDRDGQGVMLAEDRSCNAQRVCSSNL